MINAALSRNILIRPERAQTDAADRRNRLDFVSGASAHATAAFGWPKAADAKRHVTNKTGAVSLFMILAPVRSLLSPVQAPGVRLLSLCIIGMLRDASIKRRRGPIFKS
jgi:hypothetical protein